MNIPKKRPAKASVRSVEAMVRDLIDEPDKWLDADNNLLGGSKPRKLLGTPQEPVLRSLLESIEDGSFS